MTKSNQAGINYEAGTESLEDFYKRKFDWIPESLTKDIGHVNVFRLPHPASKPVPYRRRDFFKMTLCKGKSRIHYADHVYRFEKQALVFSNPFIPYKWEHQEQEIEGFYVVFNASFFSQFGSFTDYEVFQPGGNHVFELSDEEYENIFDQFQKLETELKSEYIHKYDAVRMLIYEMVHYAMKTRPSTRIEQLPINASQRIHWLFLELLERQFPIDESHDNLTLKTPADFARQLNVHINHLNRAVRSVCGKTTSQLIGERKAVEAKILLKQSKWNISEIAWSLGFTELSHFNYFFKKYVQTSPGKFRLGE